MVVEWFSSMAEGVMPVETVSQNVMDLSPSANFHDLPAGEIAWSLYFVYAGFQAWVEGRQ